MPRRVLGPVIKIPRSVLGLENFQKYKNNCKIMDKKRLCKRCSSSLSEMDPHTICKSCRQPDPQMFYCSEEDCEACSVIKVYKPLDVFLRKKELENLTKKLNSFSTHQAKQEKVPHKKNPELFTKVHSTSEEKAGGVNSLVINSIIKGMKKEGFETKTNSSYACGSSSNDGEGFKDMEKRLFDKIMSNVMTTLTSDSKPSSFEGSSNSSNGSSTASKKPPGKALFQKMIPSKSKEEINMNEDDDEFQDSLVSLFAAVNSDSLAIISKGGTGNEKSDSIFKISSTTSNILYNGTVLNSPLQATKLKEEFNIENEESFWPNSLNASDILHSNFSKLPNMKLHPKVRHMHNVLFGKLNPSLPADLFGNSFLLPPISLELKNECLFAREQLQRLLLMFSMVDYFSGVEIVSENPSLAKLLELLLNQLKTSIEKQANFVGMLIQEIRRDMLSDAECKEPGAITKLIMGPVHQTQFFGPYVKDLQEIVSRKGPLYCLTPKSDKAKVNLCKLPSKFKEGESANKFLKAIAAFFDSNATCEKDKNAVFESLLPTEVIDRLLSFIKPLKLPQTSFAELALAFEKLDQNNCTNFLLERHSFSKIKQSHGQSVKEYANFLETLIKRCMYGGSSREILRDQFVFGLKDENVQQYLLNKFSWSFEECVVYSLNVESNDSSFKPSKESKFPYKRKIGHNEEESSSKKLKLPEVKNTAKFYPSINLKNPKNIMLDVNTVQQWNENFGFEVNYSFNVNCPWTGQILRS